MDTKLSAIVPNFNHGHSIGNTLRALVAQSVSPFEIVVVDDCSTDNSRDILMGLACEIPQLKLTFLDVNGGAINAMNTGLRLAKGDYVYFGAADDTVVPGLIETLLLLAHRHPTAAFASGEARVIDEDTGQESIRPPARPANTPSFFSPEETCAVFRKIDNWILTGAAIWRRDYLVAEGGFDPNLGAFADGFLVRKLAFKYGCCFTPYVGWNWHINSTGLSRSQAANVEKSNKALQDAIEAMGKDIAFPNWYLPLFERRWRFALGRLAVRETPINIDALKGITCVTSADRHLADLFSRFPLRVSRFLLMVWLTVRFQPMSLTRLARTNVARRFTRTSNIHSPSNV